MINKTFNQWIHESEEQNKPEQMFTVINAYGDFLFENELIENACF
jgi:hypothetical protein